MADAHYANVRRFLFAALFLGMLFYSATSALAQTIPTPFESFDKGLENLFTVVLKKWTDTCYSYARTLFWILVLIELTWSAVVWSLEKGDLQSFTAAFVRKLMWIGFFAALLQLGPEILMRIIFSFDIVGTKLHDDASARAIYSHPELYKTYLWKEHIDYASGRGMFNWLSPSSFFDMGVKIFAKISGYRPQATRDMPFNVLDLLAMTTLGVYVAIGAQLLVYQIELLIVVSAGILFLGFGGSKFSEQFATRYLSYAIGVGVKVFLFMIVLGIAFPFLIEIDNGIKAAGDTISLTEALPIYGLATMLMLITRNTASIAAGLSASVGSMETGQGAHTLGQQKSPGSPTGGRPPFQSSGAAIPTSSPSNANQGLTSIQSRRANAPVPLASAEGVSTTLNQRPQAAIPTPPQQAAPAPMTANRPTPTGTPTPNTARSAQPAANSVSAGGASGATASPEAQSQAPTGGREAPPQVVAAAAPVAGPAPAAVEAVVERARMNPGSDSAATPAGPQAGRADVALASQPSRPQVAPPPRGKPEADSA